MGQAANVNASWKKDLLRHYSHQRRSQGRPTVATSRTDPTCSTPRPGMQRPSRRAGCAAASSALSHGVVGLVNWVAVRKEAGSSGDRVTYARRGSSVLHAETAGICAARARTQLGTPARRGRTLQRRAIRATSTRNHR
jgi:hypothetical protein